MAHGSLQAGPGEKRLLSLRCHLLTCSPAWPGLKFARLKNLHAERTECSRRLVGKKSENEDRTFFFLAVQTYLLPQTIALKHFNYVFPSTGSQLAHLGVKLREKRNELWKGKRERESWQPGRVAQCTEGLHVTHCFCPTCQNLAQTAGHGVLCPSQQVASRGKDTAHSLSPQSPPGLSKSCKADVRRGEGDN